MSVPTATGPIVVRLGLHTPDHSPSAVRPIKVQSLDRLRLSLLLAIGRGYIAATVKKQEQADPAAAPVARRVVLLVEPTMQQVAETWSDPATGTYRFDGLNPEARFTVVAFDHLHDWRAVIADNLAPERIL